jgi:hypothetical protein
MQTAAISLIVILALVAMFQLALVLGAPMGEYVSGGQNPGKLTPRLRVASAISILIYVAIAGHLLAQIGLVPKLFDGQFNALGNWGMVGILGASLAANAMSKSKKERQLWVPVLLLAVVLAFIVALG